MLPKMSESDFDFLQKLMDQYEEEARKCKEAGVPLAGSVMYAAAMEAALLAIAYCDEDGIRGTDTYVKAGENDLRKWGLKQLLDLANEMKWLPSNLPLGEIARLSGIDPDEALKHGDVAYFADVVREVRDMVHAGRYLRLWSGVEVGKEYVDSVEEYVQIVYDHLYDRLITLIKNNPEFKKLASTMNEEARTSP